jgi:hypothetical protein
MRQFETSTGSFTNAQKVWRIYPHLRSIIDPDGGLVLNLKTGRFHGLNRTSAVVWDTLRHRPGGVDAVEILQAMAAAFGSNPRMTKDLDLLMQTFEEKGFVQRCAAGCRDRDNWPFAKPDSCGEPAQKDAGIVPPLQFDVHPPSEFTNQSSGLLWTSAAWLSFLVVNLILWTGGFPRLHQALRWFSARRKIGPPAQQKITTVCAAVNRAATLYLRKSWCLHRAAVTFALLRFAGVPAEFVIGCRRLPFYSHAWVEVRRVVVNDKDRVRSLYPELDRFGNK